MAAEKFLDKLKVINEQKQDLNVHISNANKADELSNFNDLEIARGELKFALGMYCVLSGLGYLTEKESAMANEELERIAEKLNDMRKERLWKKGKAWRS
jgi:hypothetical protein